MDAGAELQKLIDRAAIIDLVNGYFLSVDSKAWDKMDMFFHDDATMQETADRIVSGRGEIVKAFRSYEESDEIVLFDLVGSFTPVIDGDTAHADIPVRSRHHGAGARDGKYYESMAVMETDFARTAVGWRITHYDWKIKVRLGVLGELYEPELKRAGRRATGSGGSMPVDD